MQVAWNEVNKKLNYSTKFSNYFNNIGLPFEDILKKIELKETYNKQKIYKNKSITNFQLIQTYPDVRQTIKQLKNRGYLVAIITSKNVQEH